MKATHEKRRHSRINLSGYYTADLIGRTSVNIGIVQNVSLEGIQLYDLPDNFTAEIGKQFKIKVSGFPDTAEYVLTVQSKWRCKNGPHFAVGFEIVQAPAEWNLLIWQVIPPKNAVSSKSSKNKTLQSQQHLAYA